MTDDPEHRSRLEEFEDREPLFLRCVERSSATRLFVHVGRHSVLGSNVTSDGLRSRLPHLHPHLIRHAHATMRVQVVLEEYPHDGERQCAAIDAVQVQRRPRFHRRGEGDNGVDYISARSDLVRSAYTRGAVASRLVDWNDLLEQPGEALPPDADPARPGNVRRKAAAYRALPREQQVRVLLEWLPQPPSPGAAH
jgi:hypothetical protein